MLNSRHRFDELIPDNELAAQSEERFIGPLEHQETDDELQDLVDPYAEPEQEPEEGSEAQADADSESKPDAQPDTTPGDLRPSTPICPITYEELKSDDKEMVGTPDGYTYKKAAISEWVGRKGKSPMNPNQQLTSNMFFNPVAARKALEYAEYQKSRKTIYKSAFKQARSDNFTLQEHCDQVESDNEYLLNRVAKLESQVQKLTQHHKLFKSGLKRKLEEIDESIKADNPRKSRRTGFGRSED